GGGWCSTPADCLDRTHTYLGSTNLRNKNNTFANLLDDNPAYNPDLHNWNKVRIAYCDGAFYAGDVQQVD
ncbi:hypothetical protein M569_13915, partial [Genlisea aurea]